MATFFEYLVFAPLTAAFFGFLVWLFVAIILRRVVERIRIRPVVFFVTGYAFIGLLSIYQLVGYDDPDVAPLLGTVASLVLVLAVRRWWRGRRGSTTVARFNRASGPRAGAGSLGGPASSGGPHPGQQPADPGHPGPVEQPGQPGQAGYPGFPGQPGHTPQPGQQGRPGQPFVPPHGQPDHPGWTPGVQGSPSAPGPGPGPGAGRRPGYPLAAPPPPSSPFAPPPPHRPPPRPRPVDEHPEMPGSGTAGPTGDRPAADSAPEPEPDIDPTWLDFLATESGGANRTDRPEGRTGDQGSAGPGEPDDRDDPDAGPPRGWTP
ncbi:hypothetical protein CC117_15380 [Parafrankia colletiae]|uniref:Uncharacterized protein n=1 Tax=Parafrankia colletiae TaxID=573497 RepID=A0A1S1QUF0_9ACTN|nr:hypothetical protein [Parafrankia colletiae]MCK9898868.1 hypothetical protein [Frankia sp. Cpl3]OHV38328.1 hypothetical protein CC117_15380 [Parafrankia colletiae]